MIKKTSVYRL